MLHFFCGEDGPEILKLEDRAAQCEPKTTIKLLKMFLKTQTTGLVVASKFAIERTQMIVLYNAWTPVLKNL